MNDLLVPINNIRRLRNEQATRDKILQAFDGIKTHPGIGYGDPILIFFAGHGGETDGPQGWDSKIQFLIPYDCETSSGGVTVHGIPDFLFGRYLDDISKVKGNNIVSTRLECSKRLHISPKDGNIGQLPFRVRHAVNRHQDSDESCSSL